MASKTDIANIANYKLGEPRVNNIDLENKESARVLKQFYPFVISGLIQAYPWNFAIKRAALAADVAVPAFGYSKQYSLPSDCVSLYEVDGYPDYKVEGGKILCDEIAPLNIRYVSNDVVESEFSPLFIEAAGVKLAFDACEKITQSSSKKEQLYGEFKQIIALAQASDAIEDLPIDTLESSWIESRY